MHLQRLQLYTVLTICCAARIEAFVSSSVWFTQQLPQQAACSADGRGSPRYGTVDDEDLESVRRDLESLIGTTDDADMRERQQKEFSEFIKCVISPFDPDPPNVPTPPPMTAAERERRLLELELLDRLRDSDEAVGALWKLWYSERGSKAEERLREADQLMADPSSWEDCEECLIQIIKEYGIDFVESLNRLATFYFLCGLYQESYKVCYVILQLKPWHVGALAGMVQVCMQLGEGQKARMWADRRFPPLGNDNNLPSSQSSSSSSSSPSSKGRALNPRRLEWVDRAVADARKMLQLSEQRLKKSLGKPEEYYNKKGRNDKKEPDQDADVWQ